MRGVALLIVPVLACTSAEQRANEEKLAALEQAMEGYEAWDQLPEWTGIEESLDGTHGTHVQIWVDEAFVATVGAGGSGAMPAGVVAVKQGYDDALGAEPGERVAHQRQDDGTLFFAIWDADGATEDYGRPATCTDCHALGQDEVMAVTW